MFLELAALCWRERAVTRSDVNAELAAADTAGRDDFEDPGRRLNTVRATAATVASPLTATAL